MSKVQGPSDKAQRIEPRRAGDQSPAQPDAKESESETAAKKFRQTVDEQHAAVPGHGPKNKGTLG